MSNQPYWLTEANTKLLVQHPFFASLLMDMLTVKITRELPTAAVDEKTLYINPDFFESLDINERVFVIAHEVAHAMWEHVRRFKWYADHGAIRGLEWSMPIGNAAADYIINDLLFNSQVGKKPEKCLHDTGIADYNSDFEEVYVKLFKQFPPQPKGDKGQGEGQPGEGESQEGNGGSQPHPDTPENFDEHKLGGNGSEPGQQDPQWQRAVASAANAAKAQGRMPGALQEFVDNLLKPKTNWIQQMADWLRMCVGGDTKSWRKPNRRKIVMPRVYMPSRSGFEMGPIVVAIDTSASVSSHELKVFLSELASLLNDVRPEVIHLIQCDTRIVDVQQLARGTDLTTAPIVIKGRGGTYFEPVFQYVEEEGINPEVLLYFTDMEAGFPDDPGYPVLWVASTDHKAPWGRTIKLEIDHGQR